MGKSNSNHNDSGNKGVQNITDNSSTQGTNSGQTTLGDNAIQELVTNNHNETFTSNYTENKTTDNAGNSGQITNTNTDIAVRDSEILNQNYIGLQGDDLANVLNAWNKREAQSQTALLATNNQLATITGQTKDVYNNAINSTKKSNYFLIAIIAIGGGFLAYKVIKK